MSNKQSDQLVLAEKEAETCTLFKRVFGTPEGEKVLEILSSDHHFLETTFRENPNNMYFAEGERYVIRNILKRLEVDEVQQLRKMRKYYDKNLNNNSVIS